MIKIQQESEFIAFVESTGAVMHPQESIADFDSYLKAAIVNETKIMGQLGIKI